MTQPKRSSQSSGSDGTSKRVLIVFCYFPETREPVRLPNEIPNALAPILLAAEFNSTLCEIRIHNEVSAGFVEIFAPALLEWPDMVVFSGLSNSLDRVLQITAYLKTANPAVITVAGGIVARTFRRFLKRRVDYVCVGDLEDVREVIRDAYSDAHVAPNPIPRYDLAPWLGRHLGYVESSRNCNFRCSFCSLTGEGNRYAPQSLEHLRAQILALGRRDILFFADNQFHGSDRAFFLQRLDLLRELKAQGYFRFWTAFVTNSFLWNEADVQLAAESGCLSLFIGVESFDEAWLNSVNKQQNSRYSQVELIERCCEAGILFQYGMVFDPTERTLQSMNHELDLIAGNPAIPAPNFIFMAIPLPGTPFFHDRAKRGMLLPSTRVRDLDGSTVTMQTLDDVEDVARFIASAKYLRGKRTQFLRHHIQFLLRYRRSFKPTQAIVSSLTLATTMAPRVMSDPRNVLKRRRPRTHISSTDRLDCVYHPVQPVAARYAEHFVPTQITDESGNLNEVLAADLLDTRFMQRTASPS